VVIVWTLCRGRFLKPAGRVVALEAPGAHHHRDIEIYQEIYERSHYVIDNKGSRFENELKTNPK
jgi:hypothetical protein